MQMRANAVAKLDDELCPVEGPMSVTAMLLDVTDPIAEITKVDLKRQFQKAVAAVEQGGLVEVYTLTDEEGKLTRTFRGCNPGDDKNADVWISNPKMIQKRWQEGFERPLREVEDRIGEGTEAKRSPIMAGIQRIVIESFSDKQSEGKPKKIYVASDTIEHTDSFSIYKSGPDTEAYEKSTARDRYRTPLDGVEVKFLVFQRETAEPISGLPEFWLHWVQTNGGEFLGYERLAGVE
ncbi:hypothetical protein [Ensifer sp. BR816]|uniref:hypothetical protein n=1 Tax=Rhizobium sp. (strain BR816) TaxID=1057002 RepID=UPI001FD9B2C9|nr:hypothetical protein [Ensifer sp. BR816]